MLLCRVFDSCVFVPLFWSELGGMLNGLTLAEHPGGTGSFGMDVLWRLGGRTGRRVWKYVIRCQVREALNAYLRF